MEESIIFSEYALRRMSRRGITKEQVCYCVTHHSSEEEYCPANDEIVFPTVLPDGRNIKVRIRDGNKKIKYVIDAFSFNKEKGE
jgi:hypothetical protein